MCRKVVWKKTIDVEFLAPKDPTDAARLPTVRYKVREDACIGWPAMNETKVHDETEVVGSLLGDLAVYLCRQSKEIRTRMEDKILASKKIDEL